jgi:hypothetical protein
MAGKSSCLMLPASVCTGYLSKDICCSFSKEAANQNSVYSEAASVNLETVLAPKSSIATIAPPPEGLVSDSIHHL